MGAGAPLDPKKTMEPLLEPPSIFEKKGGGEGEEEEINPPPL